ncbi:VOC family protein [Streptomyces sp. LHD-70]|uniref:VOC family protein n=1 Tax=Streptomyces sp. LHD-70 TaxID=3072140 RepID=UPI00280C7B53|nr:VOC family protein [Streptomyces sp. LHD-70]MDQ8701765.1 VOC family protein [Streptomyces sp. LHD-70]
MSPAAELDHLGPVRRIFADPRRSAGQALVLATPDLDDTVAEVTAATGVAPAEGGRHLGYGTRNFLYGLAGEAAPRVAVAPRPYLRAVVEGTRGRVGFGRGVVPS